MGVWTSRPVAEEIGQGRFSTDRAGLLPRPQGDGMLFVVVLLFLVVGFGYVAHAGEQGCVFGPRAFFALRTQANTLKNNNKLATKTVPFLRAIN